MLLTGLSVMVVDNLFGRWLQLLAGDILSPLAPCRLRSLDDPVIAFRWGLKRRRTKTPILAAFGSTLLRMQYKRRFPKPGHHTPERKKPTMRARRAESYTGLLSQLHTTLQPQLQY
jgi:hypothetical protein